MWSAIESKFDARSNETKHINFRLRDQKLCAFNALHENMLLGLLEKSPNNFFLSLRIPLSTHFGEIVRVDFQIRPSFSLKWYFPFSSSDTPVSNRKSDANTAARWKWCRRVMVTLSSAQGWCAYILLSTELTFRRYPFLVHSRSQLRNQPQTSTPTATNLSPSPSHSSLNSSTSISIVLSCCTGRHRLVIECLKQFYSLGIKR